MAQMAGRKAGDALLLDLKHFRRKISKPYQVVRVVLQYKYPLYQVAQFSYVARPMVGHEYIFYILCE